MCVGDEMMIRDAATKVLRRMHASAGDRKRTRCLAWEATATVRDECKGAESNVNGINRSFSETGGEHWVSTSSPYRRTTGRPHR